MKIKSGDFVLCVTPQSDKSKRFDLTVGLYKVTRAYSDVLHLENTNGDLGFNITRFVLVDNTNKLISLILD